MMINGVPLTGASSNGVLSNGAPLLLSDNVSLDDVDVKRESAPRMTSVINDQRNISRNVISLVRNSCWIPLSFHLARTFDSLMPVVVVPLTAIRLEEIAVLVTNGEVGSKSDAHALFMDKIAITNGSIVGSKSDAHAFFRETNT